MYNLDDILIVGDSFCSDRTDKHSWPQQVLNSLTGLRYSSSQIPRGVGYPGGAWWAYRQSLIAELSVKIPKVLIIFHTEPYRLPNNDNLSINYHSVETQLLSSTGKGRKMPKKLAEAALLYYQELICTPFYDWANKQLYRELEKLIEPIEKVIHIHCFETTFNYVFAKGTTVTYPLYKYTETPKTFLGTRSRPMNHFSVEGNKLFAQSIVKILNNYPADGTEINSKLINYEN